MVLLATVVMSSAGSTQKQKAVLQDLIAKATLITMPPKIPAYSALIIVPDVTSMKPTQTIIISLV
jgi:hypothetical protein